MTELVARSYPSPIGSLTLVGSAEGLVALKLPNATVDASIPERPDAFGDVVEQLGAYFAGELTAFDVALALAGTPFQRSVWSALCEIPYGTTVSYGELAATVGSPGAARAVGLANNRNPVAIIVPCHRVIGADGSLTGYGGGIDCKRTLLELERRHAPETASGRLPIAWTA